MLVDTNVWSAFLRKRTGALPAEAQILRACFSEGRQVFLTGIILQEVLQGFRDELQAERLRRMLEPVPLILPTREDHVFAAKIFNQCRSRGISVSTPDCLIASLAICSSCYLLSSDQDFERIKKYFDLRLLKG